MKKLLSVLFFCACVPNDERDVWEKTHSIWNFGIIQSASRGMDVSPFTYFASAQHLFNASAYDDSKEGDILWVQCRHLPNFVEWVLPNIAHRFVLVVSDGDETFPTECGLNDSEITDLLNQKNLLHIFAQNYDGTNAKVSHLPIGMDFHTPAYKGRDGGWGQKGSPRQQEQELNNVMAELRPTSERKLKAYVDFHHSDTMRAGFKRYLQFGEDRKSIFEKLVATGLIDHGGFMKRTDLWKRKGEYAFSISPHGNGLDCHRTWEDLILGCIVIVKTSPLDPLYDGLPVVIVQDWSEITAENLEKWAKQYFDAFDNPAYREKLTNDYWLGKIQAKALGVIE